MTDFWHQVQQQLVDNRVEVFYRLYHDDQGCPLFYSMEDLPGNYIEIDADTFARGPLNVKVRNGKLVEVANSSNKLVPGEPGFYCDPQDVTVITKNSGQCWTMKNYESNN